MRTLYLIMALVIPLALLAACGIVTKVDRNAALGYLAGFMAGIFEWMLITKAKGVDDD